jgi:hypothetical protein
MQNQKLIVRRLLRLLAWPHSNWYSTPARNSQQSEDMIFKQKDSIEDQIQELEQALAKPLPASQRQRLEKDLNVIRAGLKGEQEAAYHIDFHLKDVAHWAVIHDLRLEWNGRVAQIDHLLIDRLLEIYVIESKSFRNKIRYANGGWERINFNHWEGIPSPVEQNERHIAVISEMIRDQKLAPTRLGMTLQPTFFNMVVVMPSCSITGRYPEDVRICRMDSLVTKIRSEDPSALDVFKLIAPQTLHNFATSLLLLHKPAPRPKNPILEPTEVPTMGAVEPSAAPTCQGCGGPLTAAEANYCQLHQAQFEDQLLCRKCQRKIPNAHHNLAPVKPAQNAPPDGEGGEVVARCAECGAGLDRKVVAFCRFNSKRLGGRVLCRSCQVAVV